MSKDDLGNRIVALDISVFDKVTNKVDIFFNGTAPETRSVAIGSPYKTRPVEIAFPWDKISEEGVDKAFEQFNKRAKSGRCRGEYGSPKHEVERGNPAAVDQQMRRQLSICEDVVSHYVTNLEKTATGLKFEVTPCGPMGELLDRELEAGYITFNPRFGFTPKVDAKPELSVIIAFDAVSK